MLHFAWQSWSTSTFSILIWLSHVGLPRQSNPTKSCRGFLSWLETTTAFLVTNTKRSIWRTTDQDCKQNKAKCHCIILSVCCLHTCGTASHFLVDICSSNCPTHIFHQLLVVSLLYNQMKKTISI